MIEPFSLFVLLGLLADATGPVGGREPSSRGLVKIPIEGPSSGIPVRP